MIVSEVSTAEDKVLFAFAIAQNCQEAKLSKAE